MKKSFLILGILIVCAGCASVPYDQVLPVDGDGYVAPVVTPVQTSQKSKDLKDLCERYAIEWQFDRISQVVTLSKQDRQARVLLGSQVVLFNDNQRVVLDDPISMKKDGSITASSDFSRKVLSRFRFKEEKRRQYSLRRIRKVVIDAGHGGKDSGALGKNGLQEKKVVLDISQRLGKLLRKEGLEIVYTRKDDQFISLQERTEIASKEAADLFISVHANAAKSRSVHGVEVFHLKPLTAAERKEKQRLDNQKYLYKELNAADNHHVHNILDDLLYTQKQAESYYLAQHLSKNLSKDMRTRNRGDKNSRFFVLRNTLIPAILVEVGFLSNPREEKKLDSNKYRQRIARSISESILAYAAK